MKGFEIERFIGGSPRIAVADILGHPRFPQARTAYLDRFLSIYSGDPVLARLQIESGRLLVYVISVVLESAQDSARRETWFTVGRLKQEMAVFGLASGRHIDALVARLCGVGYMRSAVGEHDRRTRILSTTEKMRAHDRDWIAAHHVPLSILYPEHGYDLALNRDKTFHLAHRKVGLAFLPLAAKLYLSEPDMVLFLNRAAGYLVLASLLQKTLRQSERGLGSVPFSNVGDRFGVSRTHVRKLLIEAENAGLVKLHARGGQCVEVLPRLIESHDRSIANGMFIHDLAYVATTKHLT